METVLSTPQLGSKQLLHRYLTHVTSCSSNYAVQEHSPARVLCSNRRSHGAQHLPNTSNAVIHVRSKGSCSVVIRSTDRVLARSLPELGGRGGHFLGSGIATFGASVRCMNRGVTGGWDLWQGKVRVNRPVVRERPQIGDARRDWQTGDEAQSARPGQGRVDGRSYSNWCTKRSCLTERD